MSPVNIRRVRPIEAPVLRSVHRAAVSSLCNTPYNPDQIKAWLDEQDPQQFARLSASAPTFVAEQDGGVVGFAVLTLEDGVVQALYVHPCRTRRGIATLLLATLEDEARQAGRTSLRLNATLNSVTFFEARGFRSLGPGASRLPDGVALPRIRMERGL